MKWLAAVLRLQLTFCSLPLNIYFLHFLAPKMLPGNIIWKFSSSSVNIKWDPVIAKADESVVTGYKVFIICSIFPMSEWFLIFKEQYNKSVQHVSITNSSWNGGIAALITENQVLQPKSWFCVCWQFCSSLECVFNLQATVYRPKIIYCKYS